MRVIDIQKQVFIINGSGGVGKDTFVSLIDEISSLLVRNFSSVDKVKHIARMIGWDGSKTEKNRKFLSDLKLLCTDFNDMPFYSMAEEVERFRLSNYDMLFLHIREPEEIEKAKSAFHAKTILVKRDSVKQITSNMADANVTNYQYDIEIDNSGDLDDLREKVYDFVSDFRIGDMKPCY